MKKQYFLNANIVDPANSVEELGGLIINENGKIEAIGLSDTYKISSNGGKPKKLAETPNRNASLITVSVDNNYVFVFDFNRTKSEVYKISLNSNDISPMLNLNGRVASAKISDDNKKIVFVKQELDKPSEVFVSELNAINPKQISNFNPTEDFPKLAKTDLITWKSKDGLEIEGLITYPTNYRKRKKYPLAVIIHGGPAGVFSETFTGARSIYKLSFSISGIQFKILRFSYS